MHRLDALGLQWNPHTTPMRKGYIICYYCFSLLIFAIQTILLPPGLISWPGHKFFQLIISY